MSTDWKINGYYYSQYLFERVNPVEGVLYLQGWLEGELGTSGFELLNPAQKAFNPQPGFYVWIMGHLLPPYRTTGIVPYVPFGRIFEALLHAAPTWRTIFLLNHCDLREEGRHAEASKERILHALAWAAEQGWLVLKERDLPLESPAELHGRHYFILIDFQMEREEALLGVPLEFGWRWNFEGMSKELSPEPAFLAAQLAHHPCRLFEQFLFVASDPLTAPAQRMVDRLDHMRRDAADFFAAAAQAGRRLLNEAPREVIRIVPTYAGFPPDDARHWVEGLVNWMENPRTPLDLGERTPLLPDKQA